MKCSEVKSFLSEISDKSINTQVPLFYAPEMVDFLATNDDIIRMAKEGYDGIASEVTAMEQTQKELDAARSELDGLESTYVVDSHKRHGIGWIFAGKDKKEEEKAKIAEDEKAIVAKQTEISDKQASITMLVQKKSMIDGFVAYNSQYLAITGMGEILLKDLNVNPNRTDNMEFSQFLQENEDTKTELTAIANRANSYVNALKDKVNSMASPSHVVVSTSYDEDNDDSDESDESNDSDNNSSSNGDFNDYSYTDTRPAVTNSQLWGVAIGLAKLDGDSTEIPELFIQSLGALQNFKASFDKKLMVAEMMTASRQTNVTDFVTTTLTNLDKSLQEAGMPEDSSLGVAATLYYGRNQDGTYALEKFIDLYKTTSSYEASALLAISNTPDLQSRYDTFKAQFMDWGHETSTDVNLASAYLAIYGIPIDEARTKMTTLLDSLRESLEYPLVPAAILTSMTSLTASETIDLMEKAVSILTPLASGLERSELVSLAIRLIHGVDNQLVQKLDPTATLKNTPVQFTHGGYGGYSGGYNPMFFGGLMFFPLWIMIFTHSTYHSNYSGIGGRNEDHYHSVGGFYG